MEALRIIRYKKPKYLLMENVKNLVGKQFKPSFNKIITELEEYGYNIYWDVLNAKDFGIPQNRERVFVICIRKDVDDKSFEFPKGLDNGLKLKDFLENEINEKFYIPQEKTEKLIRQFKNGEISKLNTNPSGKGMNGNVNTSNIANTITTNKGEGQKILVNTGTFKNSERVYLSDGNALAIAAGNLGGGEEPCKRIEENNNIKILKLKDILEADAELPLLHNIYGGFNEKEPRIFNEYSPTIRTSSGGGHIPSVCTTDCLKVEKYIGNYRIRKLIPIECWRLMGFDDEDFYKVKNHDISNTQLYKLAGNSIVVSVLEAIFKNLFKEYLNKY